MKNYILRPILMFTGTYKNDSTLDREGVLNTLLLMKQALFTNAGLNLDENDSCIIEDRDLGQAWKDLKKYIETISENDIVLFYFCGHGFPDYEHHEVVLSTSDAVSDTLDNCGIRHTQLIDIFKRKGIKNYIIIFDCCHGGFLCDMGSSSIESVFDVNKNGFSDAVYISSTMKEDTTIQKQFGDKFYIPFSYYFAKYILEDSKSSSREFSIHDIYKAVSSKLSEDKTYPAICIDQKKGDFLWDAKLFESCLENKKIVPKGFLFSSYFSTTELKVLLVKTALKHPISKYDDFGVPLGLWLLKGHLYTTGLPLKVDIYDERLKLRECNNDEEKKKKVKEQFADLVTKYDVIGISMSTSEVFPAMEKLKIAKSANKITFCGGIFTTSNEKYLINSGLVDYVTPGVSTLPTTNLLARLLQDKRQGKLGEHIINEYYVASKSNIEQFGNSWEPSILPPMRLAIWGDIIEQYGDFLIDEKTGKRRMDIYTARGCSRNCAFCSVQKESRQHQFRKDTKCVVDEIQYLESKGIEYFSIKDEDFLSNPESITNILEAVAKDGVKFKIRARYDEMMALKTPFKKLQALGVDEIQYGIESPDVYLSRNINKGFPRDAQESNLVSFIREHAKYGITANCSFILGIMGEDEEYYDSLFEFIKQIYDDTSKPKIYINFLTPHPINSSFPTQNYYLATNNLNYFTHKYPVCYAQGSTYGTRKKMLETYKRIVQYTNSEAYNPLEIPEKLKRSFMSGKSKITSNTIPNYRGDED